MVFFFCFFGGLSPFLFFMCFFVFIGDGKSVSEMLKAPRVGGGSILVGSVLLSELGDDGRHQVIANLYLSRLTVVGALSTMALLTRATVGATTTVTAVLPLTRVTTSAVARVPAWARTTITRARVTRCAAGAEGCPAKEATTTNNTDDLAIVDQCVEHLLEVARLAIEVGRAPGLVGVDVELGESTSLGKTVETGSITLVESVRELTANSLKTVIHIGGYLSGCV